jgi:hypothetical protein
MNLYLISRKNPEDTSYDEYAGAVVSARSPKDAASIHPAGKGEECLETPSKFDNWLPRSKVAVRLLARDTNEPRGVVLSDLRAS